jgi:hypothetical protein
MPYAPQQQTQSANPSSADIGQQIRAQVEQQLQQAGVSVQKANADADRAAQAANQATKINTSQPGRIDITKADGKHVIIQVPGDAPAVPYVPPVPYVAQIPSDLPLDIPPRIEHLGYALLLMIAIIAVGKPLARAIGSLIERRALKPAMPAEFGTRLERIEQGIESVSIEVERISEAQRYLLKVQSSTPDRIEAARSAS